MRLVILNWSEGENDPFSYFSAQWREQLERAGHDVHIVPLDVETILALALLQQEHPIDLAFCWQGIGSTLVPDGFEQTIWEVLRVPLVCLHADHPCYNPFNHQQSSAFILHLYGQASFASAANRYVSRQWPAIEGNYPSLLQRTHAPAPFAGDYFVLAKNIQDMDDVHREWKTRCDAPTYALLADIAAAIEQAYLDGNRVNHHDVILQSAPSALRQRIMTGQPDPSAANVLFQLTRELDRVHRIVASMFIVDALPDVPLRVYGRGWDRYMARGNPNHEFFPADVAERSGYQYQSNFGILDVASSNDMLHDRTWRAIQHGSGFLISSAWERGGAIHSEFTELFFGGDQAELQRKVAAVLRDPDGHRARCGAFADRVEAATLSTAQFLEFVEGHIAARALRP
jgi:hypothetical protein